MIQANKTIRAAPFYQLYIIADDKNEFALLAQTPQVFVKNISVFSNESSKRNIHKQSLETSPRKSKRPL
jgi:hypothetical protein